MLVSGDLGGAFGKPSPTSLLEGSLGRRLQQSELTSSLALYRYPQPTLRRGVLRFNGTCSAAAFRRPNFEDAAAIGGEVSGVPLTLGIDSSSGVDRWVLRSTLLASPLFLGEEGDPAAICPPFNATRDNVSLTCHVGSGSARADELACGPEEAFAEVPATT